MPRYLASIPPLPQGGFLGQPTIEGAVIEAKDGAKPTFGQQLNAESVQIRALTMTNAQLLALKGADVLIVDPPGLGYAIDVIDISLRINFKTPVFTLNAGTLKLFLGPSSNNVAVSADLSAILSAAVTSDNVGIVSTATGVLAQSQIENQGIFIGNTGTAQFTLGGGTLDVVVEYLILQM